MAREKVNDADRTNHPSSAPTADGADLEPDTAKTDPAKGAARGSGTAAGAVRARTVMQRRHLRLGLLMTAAVGVEIAGAAGLVTAGLLPWEWGEPLVGRTDPAAVVVQVALALAVVACAVAWFSRSEQLRMRCRAGALLGVAAVVVVAASLLWQAEPGSRGAGMAVATLAGALLAAGSVSWLIGLRRLRVLFPFGLADARHRGYGNLPAVRRAQLIGGPAGAIGAAALVAGALVVVPGWVTTVDSQTATALTLTDEPPSSAAGDPAWTVTLPAAHEAHSSTTWATTGGLVIEEASGVRAVDPRTGAPRWHWRDDAYRRVAGVLTGDTVVLALTYEGETTGRDKVVALDPATGELRWEQFNDQLVAAMARVVWAPADSDWFVVPQEESSPTVDEQNSLSLWSIDTSDGQTRWQVSEDDNCSLAGVSADADGFLVTTQQCLEGEAGSAGCRVAGLDATTGERRWAWPAGDESTNDCQATTVAHQVIVSYQTDQTRQAVGLDADTGEPLWTSEADDDLAGLRSPLLVGDALAGTEWVEEGSAGHAELVIRDAADGQLRERVVLPDGQPIEVVPAAPGWWRSPTTGQRPPRSR